LRKERRLRVFENRVLRRIFGSRGEEVWREWIELHNEELNPYPLTWRKWRAPDNDRKL
jgi:hypothetical protein